VPAGGYKVRANDTDYRFRSDTAHTWLTLNQTSDAVAVINPDGEAVLYARPRSERTTDEFFRDRTYGELWVGRRPSLEEISLSIGIGTRDIRDLEADSASWTKARVLTGVDARIGARHELDDTRNGEFAQALSELRLVKDDWELAELQRACDVTALGFEDCVRDWANAQKYGERWIEGTFFRRARAMGNDIGYDSIVGGGSHATTLHWIENSGRIVPGDLVLLDMGVEVESLYTADVTRTLPISGRFTPLQRDLYTLVLNAQQTAMDALAPGKPFRAGHFAAMEVMAQGLADLDLLPCSVEEALDAKSRVYSRWTLHGVSHMLGMDVHDCGAASPSTYPEGDLVEGMCLTVEPGLYFQIDDELVPDELRGIGIRIEDDVVVTADGVRNLSGALPRDPDAIEAWMAELGA
ncbi:MAG TPA: aminopeptidase P family protein, partial [Marmoricola sp.]|nr:aminopeptidase P family protein [Marmoricola sp.]